LFVPPPQYSASNVGFTGTIAIGGSNSVALSAGQIGILVFDATAGQHVSIQGTNSTYGNCVSVFLLNPFGATLGSNGCMQNGSYIDEQTLTQTGTYTIYVQSSFTGSITINLYSVGDISGTITPTTDGSAPVTLNFVTPGQKARLTWSGSTGQKISLLMTASVGGCFAYVTILNPDGTTLAANGCASNAFIDEQTLNQTGTYTISVSPGANTGQFTLKLYSVTDISGTITPNGSPVNLNFITPGQKARLTWSGSTSQNVTVSQSNSPGGCFAYLSILNPDGTTLAANGCSGNGSVVGPASLGTSGTFTVYMSPGPNTGSLTITLTSQ
jgi:hypothetical protein